MVQQKDVTLQIHLNDVANLFDELAKWNIEPDDDEEGLIFSIQSDNVLYNVKVNITERFTPDEQAFMFNKIPFVKTFDDIQMKTFGKVIWNWK